MAAIDVIGEYVQGLPGDSRHLADGEWGVTVAAEQAGGWPLDVGIRLVDGMVQAKALALTSPEGLDPWMLLWWNRQTRYVRFGCTQGREIWVHADMPAAGLDERTIDRLLGLVVEGALAARSFVKDSAGMPNASNPLKDSAGTPNASNAHPERAATNEPPAEGWLTPRADGP